MLDVTALQQLKQLKTELRREERRFEGLVTGSHSSYGFVRADDGKQYFLPPQQMQRALPGDRVEFKVQTDDKGRDYAELEKLLTTSLKAFCGKCVKHGNAWFVVADVPRMQRKLFVPPKQRQNLQVGDWLECTVSRHPIQDGRAQASIRKRIGSESDADFPSRYAAVNFRLAREAGSADDAVKRFEAALTAERVDLTTLPLVSIDSPQTRDIDDALCARSDGDGWHVTVAIPDPSSVIPADSPLERSAQRRAATAYLPHEQLPMLPARLSEDLLSLLAGQERLAIACHLTVSSAGEVTAARFEEARVNSRAQLNYAQLSGWLDAGERPAATSAEVWDSLLALQAATARMREWRGRHQLLMRDEPEFDMALGEDGRISGFAEVAKGPARTIVEESMIATNQAVARRLAEAGAGLFGSHAGFRSEKLGDARDLLASMDHQASTEELQTLEGYRTSIMALEHKADGARVRRVLSRFLQRGTLSPAPAPHLGMGAPCYATFTSPIRRYVDLYNQRQLKALLAGGEPAAADPTLAAQLDEQHSQLRAASQWAQRWLQAEYLTRHRDQQWPAHVVQVNAGGLVVRLDANGIEGVIEKGELGQKVKLDARELCFKAGEQRVGGLDDALLVTVANIDMDQRRVTFKRAASG